MSADRETTKKIYQKLLDDLAPHEVTPPAEYRIIKRRTYSPGECHLRAYLYIMGLDEKTAQRARYVRGYYRDETLPPELIQRHILDKGHSWIEIPGNIVYDGVLKRFYNAAGYYHVKNVEKNKEYSRHEVNDLILKGQALGQHIDPFYIEHLLSESEGKA